MSRREQNRLEKQNRILDAAIRVFAQSGYTGASMDEIAAQAEITKPTLYQYYPSKDELFVAMMSAPRDVMLMAFDTAPGRDHVTQLVDFAWSYADTVMRPDFLSLARLIIGEAHRFPQIGRDYQASGPDRVLRGLMSYMTDQRAAGHLEFEDAELAAQDFWGLVLSAPRNRALHEPDADISHKELARYVHNGLRVFLRAYATDPVQDLARLADVLAARQQDHSE